jgi:hypothetical protein
LNRYLQLPSDFPPSVRQLAWETIAPERFHAPPTTAYDRAVAIESFLRSLPYDLNVPDTPVGEDAIEFFLFEAQRGYFDYHASAMVVMLRSVGIPSRLAVGYVLRDPSQAGDETDRYAVTERDAFAWPEVYFPDLGWLEFNPTPNLPTIRRPGAVEDGPPVPPGEDAPSLADLPGLPLFPEAEDGTSSDALSTAQSDRTLWVVAGISGGLAAIVLGTAGGVGYAWRRGIAGLEPPARLWGQTLRLASWARLPAAPDQTPAEYALSLREQAPGLDDVDLLADAYVRHRYGGRQLAEDELTRLESAWRAVRGRLLRRLVGRG